MIYRSNVIYDYFTQKTRKAILFFLLFFMLIGVDLSGDLLWGETLSHFLFEIILEGLIVILAAASVMSLFSEYLKERDEKKQIQSELIKLSESKENSSPFATYINQYIGDEFKRWNLTRGEADVAILLLKGLETKSIAEKRYTSERTVRNQARTIYEKAGLSGRHELSAYFFNHICSTKFQQKASVVT